MSHGKRHQVLPADCKTHGRLHTVVTTTAEHRFVAGKITGPLFRHDIFTAPAAA
jgi:hypothetical protein